MALQNFVDKVGPVVSAAWLNIVDVLATTVFGQASTPAAALTALGAAPALVDDFQLKNAANNADGRLQFGFSAIRIGTGAGSPAAAWADGSIYLQTNAGASSPLWVRQNGAWVNVTLP